uniref:Uncharacterized protein n=2 Tax=Brassica TaxID=3705 RepID=A0A0D3CKU2_BRAOL
MLSKSPDSPQPFRHGLPEQPTVVPSAAYIITCNSGWVLFESDDKARADGSTWHYITSKLLAVVLNREKTYVRFSCNTGGDMGMNMVTKGVHTVIEYLAYDFPDMDVIGISVKTSVAVLVELNMLKNLTVSAVGGSLGGLNAHTSNIMFDEFMATCQVPAQNMESSQCITMVVAINGKDIHISITTPSIEFPSQSTWLNLLCIKGTSMEPMGMNSRAVAMIVA